MTPERQVAVTFDALESLIRKICQVAEDLAEEGDLDSADQIRQALDDYVAQMQEHTG